MFYSYIFIFSFVNTVLVLPFYTISYIVFAYLIQDFWVSTIILTAVPMTMSFVMYLLVGKCCYNYLRDKLSKYQVYNVLIHNTDTNPIILCLIIRFLYIPLGSKEYIINVLDYSLIATMFSSFVYFLSHSLVFAMLGSHLTSISDAL